MSKQKNPSQRFATTAEVAAIFAVSRPTVHEWIRRGQLKAIRTSKRPGGHYRIPIDEVEKLARQAG